MAAAAAGGGDLSGGGEGDVLPDSSMGDASCPVLMEKAGAGGAAEVMEAVAELSEEEAAL
jgi:hypothetical protein